MSYISRYCIKVIVSIFAVVIMTNVSGAEDNVANGAKIYGETCVACHGENGKGAFPGIPDFTSNTGRLSKSHQILLDHIENGFESPNSDIAMPELGGNEDLTEQDVKDVLAYILKTFHNGK